MESYNVSNVYIEHLQLN